MAQKDYLRSLTRLIVTSIGKLGSGTDAVVLSKYIPPVNVTNVVLSVYFAYQESPLQGPQGILRYMYIYSATHESFSIGELITAIAYNVTACCYFYVKMKD